MIKLFKIKFQFLVILVFYINNKTYILIYFFAYIN